MNQLHFMLQLADLTLDGRLLEAIRGTKDDLITVSRVIFTDGISRERAFSQLDYQEGCYLSATESEPDERILAANRELCARLKGGEWTSDNGIRCAVWTDVLVPTDALCKETKKLFEEALTAEQQWWFHCAIRIDQLVRPVPAYRSLSLPAQLPEATGNGYLGWTALAPPPNYETPWLLGSLPARTPPMVRGDISTRVIFADLSEKGLKFSSGTGDNVTDAEQLTASLEEACLQKMAGLSGEPSASFEDLNYLGVQVNPHRRQIHRIGRDEVVELTELEFNLFLRIAVAGLKGIPFNDLLDDWEELGGRTLVTSKERGTVDSVMSKMKSKIGNLGLTIDSRVHGVRRLIERM